MPIDPERVEGATRRDCMKQTEISLPEKEPKSSHFEESWVSVATFLQPCH